MESSLLLPGEVFFDSNRHSIAQLEPARIEIDSDSRIEARRLADENLMSSSNESLTRREFAGVAGAATFLIMKPQTVRGYQANSAVRLALLGCGNRGTAVATSFAENTTARIVALGRHVPGSTRKR
jgi:hypothetical protein